MATKNSRRRAAALLALSAIGSVGLVLFLIFQESSEKTPTRPVATQNVLNQPTIAKKLPAFALSATPVRREPASIIKLAPPSLDLKKQGMRLLDSYQTPIDVDGNYSVIEVYKTPDRFGKVRIKKDWKTAADGTRILSFSSKAPADQILVQLAEGATPAALEDYAEKVGAKVVRALSDTGLMLVQFDGRSATAMDRVITDLQNRPDLVTSGMPNYIVQLDH